MTREKDMTLTKTSRRPHLKRKTWKQSLVAMLVMALLVTMVPMAPIASWGVYGESSWEAQDDMALVVTGDEIVSKPAATNVDEILGVKLSLSNEKAYTLLELKAMPQVERKFSARNKNNTPFQQLVKGIDLEALLAASGFNPSESGEETVNTLSYAKNGNKYDSPLLNYGNTVRYYYADLSNPGEPEVAGVPAKPILAFEAKEIENVDGQADIIPDASQLAPIDAKDSPRLYVGQTERNDQNAKLSNKNVQYVLAGNEIGQNSVDIFGKTFTRAQLMKMQRVTYTYEYPKDNGTATEKVRGVALSDLLKLADAEIQDYYTIVITPADDDGTGKFATKVTAGKIKDGSNHYMLAYEYYDEVSGKWIPTYDQNKKGTIFGALKLYGGLSATTGIYNQPNKMINKISLGTEKSPFKHMTYHGGGEYSAHFAPDAITSATLTVEGPGLEGTTPVLMRELEETEDANIWRGPYEDGRGPYTYEGVKVLSLVQGLVNSQIERISDDIKVVFKNRWRQNVAEIRYADLEDAETPVILAWGISDGITTAPFVFDGSAILENDTYKNLGIDDGCLKLVYDKDDPALDGVSGPNEFKSVAYVYVEHISGAPGYKHTESANSAFNNPANTQYIVSFGGSVLGREVNYTVEELEEMVDYVEGTNELEAGGLGHRAEYNLSNTTYWYVNEYEGIKLWDLLTTKMGVSKAQYENDDETLVSFAAWDHYITSANFSMKQLADPEQFYFYEKSPLDMGTSRPTKAQLATEEYHPDNQIGEWETDHNGYPVKRGFPVVLAYGVNGYPYVKSSNMDGYAGGLKNDGGPLKVIFGKADNMNRNNPDAQENYAYFYNNGSNQLQRVQEIYVGDSVRYNTHYQNPAYQSMAETPDALTIEVIQADGTKETAKFTLKELEELLYGNGVKPIDRQERREKANYFYKIGGENSKIQDIFEGVNLNYLLFEAVGMQGSLGTVAFYSAENPDPIGEPMPLSDISFKGYNSENGTDNLGMMVAFAKNGYPLVGTNNATGYVSTDAVTGKTIKNSDGPLMLITPQTAEERDQGQLGALASVKNLKKIVVNLEQDKYAHTGDTYGDYGSRTVSFTGGVKNEGIVLKVSDIEKAQKYLVTDTYKVGGTESKYRGLNLSSFLFSPNVSASSLLSEVVIKNEAGNEYTLKAKDLTGGISGKPVLLAYGIGNPDPEALPADGKPLVPGTESNGYEAAYGNTGGPLRLVIHNGTAEECIENITEIRVEVADIDGWNHSFGVYEDYADMPALRVSGSDISKQTDFTVAEIENLPASYKVFDQYMVGNNVYVQGIDLWKLINEYIGIKEGKSLTGITVYATDGYATSFDSSQVKNGVNGKPILIAYGMGPTSENGLPLVGGNDTTDIKPGYDPNMGNAFGPLRIIVHENTGWCAKWLNNIVVGSGSHENPEAKKEVFTISGNELATAKTFSISALSALGESTGAYPHSVKDVGIVTDQATGVLLKTVLEEAGVYGDQFIYNVKTTDNTTNAAYLNITKADIERDSYFLAYKANGEAILDKDKAGAEAVFRIYRNFDNGSSWRNRLTSIIGIEAIDQFSNSVVFSISVDGKDVRTLTRNELASINTPVVTKTFGSDSVSGIVLDDLLASLGLKDKSSKITVKNNEGAIEGLTDKTITDIGQHFLAWKVGDSFVSDKVGENTYALRLYAEGKAAYTAIVGVEAQPVYNWLYDQLGVLGPASVRNAVSDGEGGYWVGTTSGLYRLDSDGNISKPYTADNDKLKVDYVIDVAPDGKGGLWVSQGWTYTSDNNHGVIHIDENGNATTFTSENTGGKLPNNYVQALEVDEYGNLWIGSSGGLTKHNPDEGTWKTWTKEEGLPAISVNTLVQDDKGGLWIGCYPNGEAGGLQPPFTGGYAYLGPDEKLTSWHYDASMDSDLNEYLLGDFWTRGIAVDEEGGAWIARSGAAPAYFNSAGYYNIDISECVGGRLDYVSPDKKTVTHYTGRELIDAIDKGIFAAVPGSDDPILKLGATPEIRAVAVDGQGGLWLGTSGLGIFHITNLGEVEGHYSSKSFDWKSGAADNVYFLDARADGTILSGSNGGFAFNEFSGIEADAGLKGLTVNIGELSPSFNKAVSCYTLGVPNDTTTVTFSGMPVSIGSVIKYNGNTSPAITCTEDVTDVDVAVSVGTSTKTYQVKVLKQKTVTANNPIDAMDSTKALGILATTNNSYAITNGEVTGNSKVASLPLINAKTVVSGNSAGLLSVEGTTVTGSTSWDGKLFLPGILAKNSVSIPNAKSVDYVVSLGNTAEELSFSKPYRLYLPNMGGKSLGFIPAGSSQVQQITAEMTIDHESGLDAGKDFGYILVDNRNVAVWARKAGTFVAYTQGLEAGIPQEEYALLIDGPGIKSEKGYTLTQLLNWKGKFTGYYRWLNNWNARGGESHSGIKLSDLLDASGLTDRAVSVTLTSPDGFVREFNLGDGELGVNKVYPNNLYMILEVSDNGNLQLIVPQENTDSINKQHWISGIDSITVNVTEVTPGGGTPGGGAGGPPTTEPAQGENTITQTVKTSIKTEPTISSGVASSTVSASGINKALDQISEGKKQEGGAGEGAKGVVEINAMSGSTDKINKAEVSLPMGSLGAMAGADNVSAAIKTDLGTVTLDPEILDQLSALSGSNLSMTIEVADPSSLTDEERALAGGRPILDIKVSVDGNNITSFGGRTILAGIPYKATETEGEDNLIVVYMDGPDKGKPVKLSLYSGDAEEMRLRTRHLSLYGVAIKEIGFRDIEKHWAGDSIRFLANRDILKGKGADSFDPDGNVTRAEFITMLANSMDGITVAGTKSAGFDDVKIGAWYTDYINWAVSQGIVSGYGDGRFGPNDKITREQMALMTDNFIKAMDMKPDVVKANAEFADKAAISSWSTAAVTRVQQYGIINGNPDGTFAPKATATRAQAAVILKGYIESLLK